MNFYIQLVIFLVLNFGALAIGSMLMGGAVQSEWYQNLNKVPWTPPGWVFGFAWTIVMITFSVFMALIAGKSGFWQFGKPLILFFWIQWILNVMWNFLFFNLQWTAIAGIEIVMLFLIVSVLFIYGIKLTGLNALWIMPYFLWLIVAISLNWYVVLNN